jgi:hypothetical protein
VCSSDLRDTERFRAEQKEAERLATERGRQRGEQKKKTAEDLRKNMYGAFKRGGK